MQRPQLLEPLAHRMLITDEAAQVIDLAQVIVKPDGRLSTFAGIVLGLAQRAQLEGRLRLHIRAGYGVGFLRAAFFAGAFLVVFSLSLWFLLREGALPLVTLPDRPHAE